MAWLNMIAPAFLTKPAILALKDYETQRKAGKDPVFDAKAAAIASADFWEWPPEENEKEGKKDQVEREQRIV